MARDAGNLFQKYAQKVHGLFVEDGLVKLQYSVDVPSHQSSGFCGRRNQTGFVKYAVENLEGQIEVSLEMSVFKCEDVELAKPFLMWHVTEASH